MLIQIAQHTPTWVWGLLVALVAVGLSQALPRQLTVRRVSVLPVVLLTLSLLGVTSTFGHPAVPLFAWAAGVAIAVTAGRSLMSAGRARWDAANARLHVPGSWLPLVLILGLFLTRYGVGAALAMHPSLAGDIGFDIAVGLACGAFSGLFLARAAALWQLARRDATAAA